MSNNKNILEVNDIIILVLIGFAFALNIFLISWAMREKKAWENPIYEFWEIQDPASQKIYICHPADVYYPLNMNSSLNFTDTNGVHGNLFNYIILKKGGVYKRKEQNNE